MPGLFIITLFSLCNRCFAQKSKMATVTIMGFREKLRAQYCRFDFWFDDFCFLVWIYEMKRFKLHVEGCLALLSNQWMHLIC